MTNDSASLQKSSFNSDYESLDLRQVLQTADQIAQRAGAILVQMRSSFELREKSEKDLVTDADLAAQIAIATAIASASRITVLSAKKDPLGSPNDNARTTKHRHGNGL